jgi:hypothetical protein
MVKHEFLKKHKKKTQGKLFHMKIKLKNNELVEPSMTTASFVR